MENVRQIIITSMVSFNCSGKCSTVKQKIFGKKSVNQNLVPQNIKVIRVPSLIKKLVFMINFQGEMDLEPL